MRADALDLAFGRSYTLQSSDLSDSKNQFGWQRTRDALLEAQALLPEANKVQREPVPASHLILVQLRMAFTCLAIAVLIVPLVREHGAPEPASDMDREVRYHTLHEAAEVAEEEA
mgnify:CR=1 FL=1